MKHCLVVDDSPVIRKVTRRILEALDIAYTEAPLLVLFKKRAGWLIVLFLSEMLTATAMGYFEVELSRAVVLALFVPLIISSGGNSGSQAATLIIRAMALQELTLKDWWYVMKKEVLSGVMLGCTLGAWCLALGLSLLQSVIAPYPVSYSENGVMARNNGSFTAFVAQLVALPVLAVAIGPFIVAGILWSDRPGLVAGSGTAALVIGAAAGYGLYRAAVRYSAPRQAELLVSISKKAEA